MDKLGISHPGKIGDTLYAVPIAREVCKRHGTTCDFYTSEYCLPLKRLLEYQPFIDKVIVPGAYEIDNMGCGIQPWDMPVPNIYERIYSLGFRRVPDRPLHEFIAASIGLGGELEIKYDYPNLDIPDEDYIVLSARGETTYKDLFLDIIEKSPIRVIQIGAAGEAIGDDTGITGLDMLETLAWIAKSKAYIGLMSSQLVLANGFPIPKVAPHDGRSWDMRHVVYSEYNHYPINPNPETVFRLVGLS